MEHIPFDIWVEIFHYACTDGGRTGAALAITSRHMRELSASSRFYSLKLTRLDQISRLLLCYERMRHNHHLSDAPQPTLNTHHLLLSFLPEDNNAHMRPWRGWEEYSHRKHKRQEQIEEDKRASETSKAGWDRQFAYVVPRLFELVGPTLETLTVLQSADIPLPYVGTKFPALRELSLLADDRMFVRVDQEWAVSDRQERAADAKHSPPFPALMHLHIVYEGPKAHPWEKTLPLWDELAPAVTHLRVSQASNIIPNVLEGITTRSFPHTRRSSSKTQARVSFPSLQKAIVQPFVLEPVKGHEYQEEACILRRAPPRRDGPSIVVMRGRRYRDGYWKDRLRWEWEGRMLGEPGCWTEREADEGEWAYERRKRAEVAALKAYKMGLTARQPTRIVSMIRLDNDFPFLKIALENRVWRGVHGRSLSL